MSLVLICSVFEVSSDFLRITDHTSQIYIKCLLKLRMKIASREVVTRYFLRYVNPSAFSDTLQVAVSDRQS